jgi:glycosyltransferase involved in cell wall biosynthesis
LGDLLFISPVLPSPTGKGVAMRAHATLEALAARHAVTCLVVPLWEPRGTRTASASLAALADVVVAPPGAAYAVHRKLLSLPSYRRIAARLATRLGPWPLESLAVPSSRPVRLLRGRRFDRVHAFRLCTAPFAAALPNGARLSIDLDDLESDKLRRVAALPDTAPSMAAALAAEADLTDRLLDAWSRRAAALVVSSQRDREILASTVTTPVIVAPNVVRVPDAAPPLPDAPPHRIVFVGGLDYAPNRDAVVWLVREIAPALARCGTVPWQIDLIGRGGPELLAALGAGEPRLVAHGHVPDVAPHLASARAVVVPLRAGGGTRIKILEALAHGRPVVATTLGAEGLELADGTHLLLADTAEAIARQLARLLADRDLGERLAAAGRARVSDAYTAPALARALAVI